MLKRSSPPFIQICKTLRFFGEVTVLYIVLTCIASSLLEGEVDAAVVLPEGRLFGTDTIGTGGDGVEEDDGPGAVGCRTGILVHFSALADFVFLVMMGVCVSCDACLLFDF